MEIRLTFLNEDEIVYFMKGVMLTNIRKNTLSNFKLYFIEMSFVRWEPGPTKPALHQNSSKY